MKERLLIEGRPRGRVIGKVALALSLALLAGLLITCFSGNGSSPLFVMFLVYELFLWIIAYVFYLSNYKLTVTDKRVSGTSAFGLKKLDLPMDMITSVFTGFGGKISVSTASGHIRLGKMKNVSEVAQVINDLLIERQNNGKGTAPVVQRVEPKSEADELKKYKELLDSGIITQEEFDAKKVQILKL